MRSLVHKHFLPSLSFVVALCTVYNLPFICSFPTSGMWANPYFFLPIPYSINSCDKEQALCSISSYMLIIVQGANSLPPLLLTFNQDTWKRKTWKFITFKCSMMRKSMVMFSAPEKASSTVINLLIRKILTPHWAQWIQDQLWRGSQQLQGW